MPLVLRNYPLIKYSDLIAAEIRDLTLTLSLVFRKISLHQAQHLKFNSTLGEK